MQLVYVREASNTINYNNVGQSQRKEESGYSNKKVQKSIKVSARQDDTTRGSLNRIS